MHCRPPPQILGAVPPVLPKSPPVPKTVGKCYQIQCKTPKVLDPFNCFLVTSFARETDRQTDGQTDRQTDIEIRKYWRVIFKVSLSHRDLCYTWHILCYLVIV